MISNIKFRRYFTTLLSVLTLLVLTIQPISAQVETTPPDPFPPAGSGLDAFGNALVPSNGSDDYAGSIQEKERAGTELSALAQTTVPAYDTGWYDQSGFHVPTNLNYAAGYETFPATYHNFFVFDLSGISSPVYAATLRAYNPGIVPDGFDGYDSLDASETWAVYDVSTPIPNLLNGTGGVAAHVDLGSGISYGDVEATSASNGNFVELSLNAFGIAAINAALGGDLAIGGALTTIGGAYDQLLFSYSHVNPRVELVLDTTSACGGVHGNPIDNCSFETNYSSWTLIDTAAAPWTGTWGIATDGQTINPGDSTYDFADLLMVTQGSPGLPHTFSATDGSILSYHLQNGPGNYRLYQDVTLGLAGDLCWDMEYNNNSGFHDPVNQYLAVNIRDSSDTLLTTLYKTTAGIDPIGLTPMNGFCIDVSAYSYMTVRVDVELQVIFAHFDAAFDNFSIEVNNPPILDPIGDQVVDEMSQLSFTATASDVDPSDTLLFSLNPGFPAGANIDPVTGHFTWTPSGAQAPGVYNVIVRVTDDGTPHPLGDKESIFITVNDVIYLPLSMK
jgi:hypothetical protein